MPSFHRRTGCLEHNPADRKDISPRLLLSLIRWTWDCLRPYWWCSSSPIKVPLFWPGVRGLEFLAPSPDYQPKNHPSGLPNHWWILLRYQHEIPRLPRFPVISITFLTTWDMIFWYRRISLGKILRFQLWLVGAGAQVKCVWKLDLSTPPPLCLFKSETLQGVVLHMFEGYRPSFAPTTIGKHWYLSPKCSTWTMCRHLDLAWVAGPCQRLLPKPPEFFSNQELRILNTLINPWVLQIR